jgi:flagellar hook assembly protein FlgD
VAILGDREFPAGRNTVTWDGRDRMGRPVGAGTYVVLIRNGDSVLTNKVTLIR